jgi:hypothetical protein
MENTENTVDFQKQIKKEENDFLKKIDEVMKDAVDSLHTLWFETFQNTSKQFNTTSYNPYNE